MVEDSSNKVLALTNEEIQGTFTREEAIKYSEEAYLELGRRKAQQLPRQRIHLPKNNDENEDYYWFNTISGGIPGLNAMEHLVHSATVRMTGQRGNEGYSFPGEFAGFSILFNIENNEPKALLHDFYLNPIKVAVSSAIVTKRLAPGDAKTMGLFGSGSQATTQVGYTCEVTNIEKIKVYSPTKESRENFAKTMDEQFSPKVIPVNDPQGAIKNCDIVTTATNSNNPVFDGSWLEPGTHINAVTPANDKFLARSEIDQKTVNKSDIIIVNSKEQIDVDNQTEILPKGEDINSDIIYEISDLLVKEIRGRTNDTQITYHANNTGTGVQWGAISQLAYEKAQEEELGTEIDVDHFMQYNDDITKILKNGFIHKED